MKHIRNIEFISPKLLKVMTEFNLTLNDIDNMDYDQFKSFCAQLDEKQLKSLDSIVTDDRWKTHIFTVLDNAAFIKNQK